jgi:GDP-L-fucose synthase
MGIIKKIVDAKRQNQPIVTCWGTGAAFREFVYAPDAAQCVIQALNNYENVETPLAISTTDEVTIKQLTELIVELVGYKGSIEWDTSKPDGQLRKSLDITNMPQYIGYKMTPLRDGLKKTISWYVNESGK